MRISVPALLATAALVAGCGPVDNTSATDDADAPLARYEAVFGNAPANDSLPTLGKADAVYPKKSIELLKYQSPVRDQNRRGDCTIFSSTALMEHLYMKAGMQTPDFSEQYLQWSVKVQLGAYPDGEGSDNASNIAAINQFGIPVESAWPYNGLEWTEANDPACKITGDETQKLPTRCWTQGEPPAAAKSGTLYKLPAGHYLNTNSIKAHVSGNHTAVAVGLDFFYQAWNHGASTLPINRADMTKGIVRYPNATDITESHKQRAGHGILIVGWDDDYQVQQIDAKGKGVVDQSGKPVLEKGFYIFKNSWGTKIFGVTSPYGAGYGMIAQRYVNQFGTGYVDDVPTLTKAPPPQCQYTCAAYGFQPNECYQGWHCDAATSCLSYTSCM